MRENIFGGYWGKLQQRKYDIEQELDKMFPLDTDAPVGAVRQRLRRELDNINAELCLESKKGLRGEMRQQKQIICDTLDLIKNF